MVDYIYKCKAPRCHSCNRLGHKSWECHLRFIKWSSSESKEGPQAKKMVNAVTTESENKTEEAKLEWLCVTALLDKQPDSPLFVPKIVNSMSIEALWDTGAWFLLIDSCMVSFLIHNGAEHKQLERPIMLQGVGGRSVMSMHTLHTTLTFDDNKPWQIKCYVVPECPWPIIIGQPFMTEHKIAALITQNKGLELYDFMSTEKVKILTIHKPIPQDSQPAKTSDSIFIPTKILTVQEFEAQKANYDKWRSMLNDDMKDLVDLLSSIKLVTSEVTNEQLHKAGYDVESQDDSNPVATATAEPVNVPCNFPEVQNELNKLITKYHNVFRRWWHWQISWQESQNLSHQIRTCEYPKLQNPTQIEATSEESHQWTFECWSYWEMHLQRLQLPLSFGTKEKLILEQKNLKIQTQCGTWWLITGNWILLCRMFPFQCHTSRTFCLSTLDARCSLLLTLDTHFTQSSWMQKVTNLQHSVVSLASGNLNSCHKDSKLVLQCFKSTSVQT